MILDLRVNLASTGDLAPLVEPVQQACLDRRVRLDLREHWGLMEDPAPVEDPDLTGTQVREADLIRPPGLPSLYKMEPQNKAPV